MMTRDGTTAVHPAPLKATQGSHTDTPGRVSGNGSAQGSTPSRVKRYERFPDSRVNHLLCKSRAYDEAKRQYAKHSGLNFYQDLIEYLRTGFVVSQPDLFALFRPIELKGERGWFVRFATGDLIELLRRMPCPLAFIAFCRHSDGVMRKIDLDTFVRRAINLKLKGRTNNEWWRK